MVRLRSGSVLLATHLTDLDKSTVTARECSNIVNTTQDWRPGGHGFNPRRGRQHSFVEIDHKIFSTVILSLSLIQEGQLSVSGERMCTILVYRLEDKACPVNVWLGKLTALDMTPLGWLGRKTSTQTNTVQKLWCWKLRVNTYCLTSYWRIVLQLEPLTHLYLASNKRGIGKQCRPRSDATDGDVWSSSILFV